MILAAFVANYSASTLHPKGRHLINIRPCGRNRFVESRDETSRIVQTEMNKTCDNSLGFLHNSALTLYCLSCHRGKV